MEDNELLRILLIAAFYGVYYLFRSLGKSAKKKAEQQAEHTPAYTEEETEEAKPLSSRDEYLRRIAEAQQAAEKKALEKQRALKRQSQEIAAEAEPSIRNLEKEAMQRLYQTEKLKAKQEVLPAKARQQKPKKDSIPHLTQIKSPTAKRNAPGRRQILSSLLKNKQQARNAILLSEILNRKY
jgi:hypothetical protein